MRASILQIQGRQRDSMGIVTSLADFSWSPGGELDAAQLWEDPRFSLYCLDPAQQRAIFTALPAAADLLRAPFMYQAQFDQAEYLAALPYAAFLRLAQQMAPERYQLLCLHNIGRCGSTVLSRALNEIDGVTALSEPDVLTNFIYLRHLPQPERDQLLRACLAWLCRPAIIGASSQVAIKFRNQAAGSMDLYVSAVPKARHLFMYRNVMDWLASFHRFRLKRGAPPMQLTRTEVIDQQATYYHCAAAAIEALAPPSIGIYRDLEGRALGWLYMLGRYLELYQSCLAIAAIRYEDLQSRREAILGRVLDLMGLPDEALGAASRAFDSDAQAGTRLARDGERGNTVALPESQQETVRALLAGQPFIQRADFILPGTIGA